MDGDGRPDTLTVDDRGNDAGMPETLRVSTASGSRSAIVLAPLNGIEVLGVAHLDGEAVVFTEAATNTAFPSVVRLVVYHNCELSYVHNAEGRPYEFNVFSSDGSSLEGVGCSLIAGRLTLVGLRGQRTGQIVTWSRTEVHLNGDQGRNGPVQSGTYVSPRDDPAIALLSTATCGQDAFPNPV